jgi:hypothetical protein
VFTVAMSLYLDHRIMAIYTGSVEVNQRWAQRLTHNSELGQLAAAVASCCREFPSRVSRPPGRRHDGVEEKRMAKTVLVVDDESGIVKELLEMLSRVLGEVSR